MSLPHGIVETPVFMPVGTQGTVKGCLPDELEKLGAQIILGNTYHLLLRPGAERLEKLGGLHKFMNWNRPILTDSGGFQVFSLAKLAKIDEGGVSFQSHLDGREMRLTPESVMEAQRQIGSDIAMILDVCPPGTADEKEVEASVETTVRWAKMARDYINVNHRINPMANSSVPQGDEKSNYNPLDNSVVPAGTANGSHRFQSVANAAGDRFGEADGSQGAAPQIIPTPVGRGPGGGMNEHPAVFGIIQGGRFPKLRQACASALTAMDFDGYAIGGVAVGEAEEEILKQTKFTAPLLPANKPRYAMGIGNPAQLLEMIGHGVDMFDCVIPTREARHGVAYTNRGKINLKNEKFKDDMSALDKSVLSPASNFSRAYLRHLIVSEELLGLILLTYHNIAFFVDLMKAAREAIARGEFLEWKAAWIKNYTQPA
jgi:queuine tRNA-ribosyltransferase